MREKLSQFRFRKLRRNIVQPHKPLAVLVPNRHVLDAGTVLDLIAHLLQLADKIVKVGAFGKRHFHIGSDHTAQCRLALAAVAPFAIRDAASVCFYDRQPVLAAQVIGNPSYVLIVGFEIVAEHFAVHKGNRIDDYVVMQVSLVQMGGHRTLKPICQTASGKFTSDLMHLVRAGFAGLKALDNMVANIAVSYFLMPAAFGCLHNQAGILRVAVKAGDIELVFRLVLVLGVVHQPVERIAAKDLCLFRVSGIVQTIFQALAYRQDFCCCHYSCSFISSQMRVMICCASCR